MEYPYINTGNEKKNNFINQISPLVVEEYLERKKINQKRITPAVVIAQAALESGWNLNAKTLFGIKGEGIVSDTKEFINGHYVTITDSFKAYLDIASAIKGYYDLMQNTRYDKATSATTTEKETYYLQECGYATDPSYAEKLNAIIEVNNLKLLNNYCDNYNFNEPCKDITPTGKTDEEIADEIYKGLWGNGEERKEKIEQAGYSYNTIQEIVNRKYYNNTSDNDKKDTDTLANEIMQGLWGNGRETRLNKFLAAGYTEQDYEYVQNIVNERSK